MKKLLLSAMCLSAFAVAGATTAPVTFAIDSEEAAAQWTVIDANSDGDPYMWMFSSADATYGPNFLYTENKSKTANDWAISPAVEMEAGNTYIIKVWFRNASSYSSDKQDFTVTAGQGNTVAAQTATVFSKSSIKDKSWVAYEGTFSPATSGEYNIGFHLTSSSYMGNCGLQKIEVTVKVPLPGAVTDFSVKAAQAGQLAADLEWTNPAVNDAGGALASLDGVKIYRSTSSTVSITDANLVGTVTEGIAPGEASTWTDTTVPSAGFYYYKLVPFCAAGDSPVYSSSVKSDWIGEDTPTNAKNVVAALRDGSESVVTLSWEMPTVGTNGGYLNPANLAWKIVRKNSASVSTTLEDAWQGELPYEDANTQGLESYTYTVYYVYNGSTAWSGATSNTVVTGGALDVPYSQDFSASNSLNLFTTLVGEEGSRTWGLSSGKLSFWQSASSGKADAWVITPAFNLEAGKAYELSFSTWRSRDDKDLYVTIGTAATIEAQDTQLWHETVNWGTMTTKTVYISVAESGRYNIGFHCYGETTSNDIYLDNLELKEAQFFPAAITEFTATAAAEGALKAELAWTNPSKTNADTDLTEITKVEVYRGSELIATLEDCLPGEAGTYTDEDLTEAGTYTYKLIPYLGENAGPAATATTGYVGVDTPAAPADVTATIDGEGIPVITFTAPTAGVNGGYIDTAAMTFTVVRMPDEKVVAEDITETTVSDESSEVLASYTYEVTAKIGDAVSAKAVSNAIIMGEAFDLPYTPNMTTAATFDLWTLPENANGKTWKFTSSKSALEGASDNIWAFTSPFNAKAGTITVKLRATCYSWRYTEKLQIGLYSEASPEAEAIGDVITKTIDQVSYPDEIAIEFEVPANGKYYIGYYLETANWSCYLSQSNVEQTSVTPESIIVFWDNTEAQFTIPTVVVGENEIVMTCHAEKAFAPGIDGNVRELMDYNTYYAEIPGSAKTITFKDSAEGAEAEPVTIENPQHLYIYTHNGSKQFDEEEVTEIDDVISDTADAVYYNLSGIRVANPAPGQMYIMVRGNKASKHIFK